LGWQILTSRHLAHTEHFLLEAETADCWAGNQEIGLAHFLRSQATLLHFLFLALTPLTEQCIQVNDQNTIPVICPHVAERGSGVVRLHFMEKAASIASRLLILILTGFPLFMKNTLPLQY
jgi:hypothetical protein